MLSKLCHIKNKNLLSELTNSPIGVLKQVFGYSDFRDGQQAVVEASLTGQDVMVLLPTGGGKSLCYQIPSLLLCSSMRHTQTRLPERISLADAINSSPRPGRK